MFLFFHPEQEASNLNYYRGTLFESLLQRYLSTLGYNVVLRRKHSSLEYDLEGTADLDGRRLIGEAKAHGKPISGEVFSSFVGKLVPIASKDPTMLGVFISTSALTADADDYRSSLEGTGLHLSVLTGEALLKSISERLHLPSVATVQEAVRSLGSFPLSHHLLVTNQGPFLLQLGAAPGGATPASFALFRSDGDLVSDRHFLEQVQKRVPDLQELTPLYRDRERRDPVPNQRAPIPEGLIVGNDWADYRLPAPPAFFVGRRPVLTRLTDILGGDSTPGVIQLKSRSGVGKSSLMARLEASLREQGTNVRLFDARNIKSVLDLWSVVQRLTEAPEPAADFSDMQAQLITLGSQSSARTVLLIDQFEAVFTNVELFAAFELLALACVKARPQVQLVLARKNDLLTTYDDSQISLERLNQVSESIVLEDFTAPEAVQLIEQIAQHSGRRVSADLKSYVLEFAQGFPWLLKRTMAHVVKLLYGGKGQAELASAALRLDDLFDEELEELDEVESDYLLRIAQRVPATYHQLDRFFDEDPYLQVILDKLTRARLLRLSGSTYDTYNDVFKEYLVYQRIPEFRLAFTYRASDRAVISDFRRALALRRFSTAELSAELRRSRGSTFNTIRELRNVGLLDKDGEYWVVPEAAIEAHERGRLGEYIRQQFVRNSLVSDLLAQLQSSGAMHTSELPSFLRERLPFVTALDDTWRTYSLFLLGWLTRLGFVELFKDVISPAKEDRAEIAKRIGNLVTARGRIARSRGSQTLFLPGCWWRHIEACAAKLHSDKASELNRQEGDAHRDLVRLGLVVDGQVRFSDSDELRACVKEVLSRPPYTDFWQRLDAGARPEEAVAQVFGLSPHLRPGTLLWLGKLLTNWGSATGAYHKNTRRATAQAELAFE